MNRTRTPAGTRTPARFLGMLVVAGYATTRGWLPLLRQGHNYSMNSAFDVREVSQNQQRSLLGIVVGFDLRLK